MAKEPTLLTYINGMPDFESLFPVLARLAGRGRLRLDTVVYSGLLRKEPRVAPAFAAAGIVPRVASKARMKLWFMAEISAADAILTVSDPMMDTPSRRHRSRYIRWTGTPAIFLQHGVYQVGVNATRQKAPMRYYSDPLLFWEDLGENRALFVPETAAHVRNVGFTKRDMLAPRVWDDPALAGWLARHPRRLLVCQSFKWGRGRYGDDHIAHFYDLMAAFLARNPQTGVIIRSHRGKTRASHAAHDRALSQDHANVVFSQSGAGPLQGTTIHDVIALCDAMVSPVSTTVLDSLYAGKPAAVFAEDAPFFADLPQISDLPSLEAFAARPHAHAAQMDAIRAHYGTLDDNLTRAAQAIEERMIADR